jgi:hypothetical protein
MRNKQKKRQNDILFILISSFIVVVAWIGFNIYHIYVTSTISEDVQAQLTPITGSFDTQTLQQLKSRDKVNPKFERNAAASQSAVTPAPTQQPDEPAVSPGPAEASDTASSAAQNLPNQPSFLIQGQ